MTNPRPSTTERERIREAKRAEILRKNKRTARLDALTIIGVLLVITPLMAGLLALATGAVWWATLWLWSNLPV
jgi:sterol desaturase/sphingolipid hydroxylase (fatty acid hydroxylase superfamily)